MDIFIIYMQVSETINGVHLLKYRNRSLQIQQTILYGIRIILFITAVVYFEFSKAKHDFLIQHNKKTYVVVLFGKQN